MVLRLDYLSCVLTILSTILVGRRHWEGWVLAGLNSVIICLHRHENFAMGFYSSKSVLSSCSMPPTSELGAKLRPRKTTDYRRDSSTSESQSGRFNTSRGLGPSAAPTMPSRSIKSMRCAARP